MAVHLLDMSQGFVWPITLIYKAYNFKNIVHHCNKMIIDFFAFPLLDKKKSKFQTKSVPLRLVPSDWPI